MHFFVWKNYCHNFGKRLNTLSDMKRILLSLTILCAIPAMGSKAPDGEKLSRKASESAAEEILSNWKEDQALKLRHNIDDKMITCGRDSMPIDIQFFGDEPQGGRSLWISMHGGGSAPQEVNDSQWRNQTRLYRPENSVYVCPRAPWNEWNMWFQAPIDPLFEELIRTAVVICGVNPDKVYLIGYSAGGDGVWRLAPRLADHWASATMMAGHPGEAMLVNVRNMPFGIWMGGEDHAFNRNTIAAEKAAELDELQRNDPEGYIHDAHILEGLPHWMKRQDTLALPWMAQYTRNTRPAKVVWRQEEVTRKAFYWLEAPADELAHGKCVTASIKGNTIDIANCDYSHLTIWLDDRLVNLNRKVRVRYDGKMLFKGKPGRSASTLRQTLEERGDPGYMFPAGITVKISEP